ncbi:hypothetical protein C2E21_3424 [Chlorella sorokiniana]|uniref:Uncharacterized protein n=1 Tax=Chlorella sorokiniana TaxID=3076 RepID=A0A2P6TVA6_CHLSO|nr:hypothetical protein C2E21_3424 [Chlorella sorokiniana]|eukprot:PRW57999.1 hypothetical protein C2E21_3424 [Chlorella sorokiniana]
MKLPFSTRTCLLLMLCLAGAAQAGRLLASPDRVNQAPARGTEPLPAFQHHEGPHIYDADVELLYGDPIGSQVAAIAAASCARAGAARCAASRAFVQQLQQHCAAVFGQDWDKALYSFVEFPCSPDFFACFGTLQPGDAAATQASCCARHFDHCWPCVGGACNPANYPSGWQGQVLPDGSWGYCDILFSGACCSTTQCG